MDHNIIEAVIKYHDSEKKIIYEQLIQHFPPQTIAKIINVINHITNGSPLIPSCQKYIDIISNASLI